MKKFIAVAALVASAGIASAEVATNSAPIEWLGDFGTATGPRDSGPADLFPSEIEISGLTGAIADVNVTLNDAGHSWAADLTVTLVSPDGTSVNILSESGGSADFAGSVTFDDDAAGPIGTDSSVYPDGIAGTFQVSAEPGSGTTAPAATGTTLADFNGGDANGTWSLYVWDDAGGDTGAITGGWTLEVIVPAPGAVALAGMGGLVALRRRR